MRGIYYDKMRKRFRVRRYLNGKMTYLGSYKTLQQAEKAYENASPIRDACITNLELTDREKNGILLMVECLLGMKKNGRVFVDASNPKRMVASSSAGDLGYVRIDISIL